MARTSKLATAVAAIIVFTAAAEAREFGAIAFSAQSGATRREAERRALSNCSDYTSSCQVVRWVCSK